MKPRVALLSLGRAQGMGEERRVGSLESIFEGAGANVVRVPLLRDHGVGVHRRPTLSQTTAVLRGTAMTESLAWSLPSVRRTLLDLAPSAVVAVTGRAFHPGLVDVAPVFILDYVDRLATSYRDRSAVEPALGKRMLYRAVARTAARFEAHPQPHGRRIAAGWNDAASLRSEWVPNVVELPPEPATPPEPDHDVLFFGNLAYPPNISGVRELAEVWNRVDARRPETSVLIAGAGPGEEIRALAETHRWDVEDGFDDVVTLCRRARVAVAPLVHTAGIQNKVLEAAAVGLAQVATPQAVAGFKPGLPIRVAEAGAAFADALVDLLGREDERVRAGAAARAHIAGRYVPNAWAAWAADVLNQR